MKIDEIGSGSCIWNDVLYSITPNCTSLAPFPYQCLEDWQEIALLICGSLCKGGAHQTIEAGASYIKLVSVFYGLWCLLTASSKQILTDISEPWRQLCERLMSSERFIVRSRWSAQAYPVSLSRSTCSTIWRAKELATAVRMRPMSGIVIFFKPCWKDFEARLSYRTIPQIIAASSGAELAPWLYLGQWQNPSARFRAFLPPQAALLHFWSPPLSPQESDEVSVGLQIIETVKVAEIWGNPALSSRLGWISIEICRSKASRNASDTEKDTSSFWRLHEMAIIPSLTKPSCKNSAAVDRRL